MMSNTKMCDTLAKGKDTSLIEKTFYHREMIESNDRCFSFDRKGPSYFWAMDSGDGLGPMSSVK